MFWHMKTVHGGVKWQDEHAGTATEKDSDGQAIESTPDISNIEGKDVGIEEEDGMIDDQSGVEGESKVQEESSDSSFGMIMNEDPVV